MVRPNKKKNSKDPPLTATVKTLEENVDDIRHKQQVDIHEIREKQEKILKDLEELRATKKVQTQIPAPGKSVALDSDEGKGTTVVSGKEFVLKHVFKNVLGMEEGDDYYSEEEEHFGVLWKINVNCEDEHVEAFLHCLSAKKETEEWAIDVESDIRICSTTGKFHSESCEAVFKNTDNGTGWGREMLKWDELMKDYVIDDSVTVEIHVKIKKMSGIYKENLRNFDESNESFSDVVLVVGEDNFYISKFFLANHSTYFKALFLKKFQESAKSEISLIEVDPADFQNYLEILYGDPAIDETTVEGILLVADMYDTQIVVGKCEDFLMKESKKSMKKKLEMATRYNLAELKKKCLSDIKTGADIKAAISANLRDTDPSILADLLEKSLSLH